MSLFRKLRTSRLDRSLGIASLFAVLTLGLISAGCKPQDAPPAEVSNRATDSHEHDHAGHGSGESGDARLIVAAQPDPPVAGAPTTLRLMIHRTDGSMVREFDLVHEKQVHLILVREGLDEFAHLHPDVDEAGNAAVEHTFPVGGNYFVYADHQPAGERPATAKTTLKVEGESPAAPTLAPDVPGRVFGGGLTADVAVEATGEGEARSIAFTLSDAEGKPVADLESYLGALGHLVIVSENGQEYVHAHPQGERNAKEGHVAFEAHFTKPGLYKGWGQFQRAGEVLTIPFVVRVNRLR